MGERISKFTEWIQEPLDEHGATGYIEGGVTFGALAGMIEPIFVVTHRMDSVPAQTLIALFALAGSGCATYGVWQRQRTRLD